MRKVNAICRLVEIAAGQAARPDQPSRPAGSDPLARDTRGVIEPDDVPTLGL